MGKNRKRDDNQVDTNKREQDWRKELEKIREKYQLKEEGEYFVIEEGSRKYYIPRIDYIPIDTGKKIKKTREVMRDGKLKMIPYEEPVLEKIRVREVIEETLNPDREITKRPNESDEAFEKREAIINLYRERQEVAEKERLGKENRRVELSEAQGKNMENIESSNEGISGRKVA